MPKKPASNKRLLLELDGLRARLYEAEEALHAIRRGDVDALIVPSEDGEQIFTQKGADRFYRILIENMDEGALTLTAEGVILYANQGFTAMLKTPLEKMIGSSIRRWIAPSDKEIFQALLRQDDTPVPSHGEVMLLASDGTVVPVYLSINNSILQREELPGIYFITSIDLTEKKRLAQESLTASNQAQLALLSVIEDQIQSDKALRMSEEKYRSLVDEVNDGFYIADSEGVLTFVNSALVRMFGVESQEALVGRKFLDFVAPETLAELDDSYRDSKRMVRDPEVIVVQIVRPDGTRAFVEVKSAAKCQGIQIVGTRGVVREITERKRAEDGMRVALTKYKTLFNCFPLGITVSDERGMILESNPTAEKLLGVPQDEHNRRAINGPEWPKIRPDGTPMPPDEFASVRALKEKRMVENVEMGITKSDSTITWISVTAAPLPLEGHGVVVTYSDITERKQSEEALRKSEKIFRLFMEHSPIYVFFKDENIRAIRLSQNFERMLGKPMSELLGRDMNELFPSELAKRMVADDMRIIKEGNEISVNEELNGRFYTTIKFPIHIEGKPSYLAGFTIDITERKKMEDALQKSEEKFRNYIDKSPDGVFLVDDTGRYLEANEAACRISGYSKEELEKISFADLVAEESLKDGLAHFKKIIETGAATSDLWHKTKDGSKRCLTVNAVKLSETRFLGFCKDITERKRAEDELQRRLKELQRWHDVTVDREERILEMKKEVNDLLIVAGRPAKYGG